MGLCRTISEINGYFSRKLQIISTSVYFAPQLNGSLSNWVAALSAKKLAWWGCRAEKKVWRYLQPYEYNTRTWQTDRLQKDRQTDRHRTTAKTAFTHSIMSRGKKRRAQGSVDLRNIHLVSHVSEIVLKILPHTLQFGLGKGRGTKM